MKTVIFDLDGTLADTSGDLIAAANACFEQLGHGAVLDETEDMLTAFHGGRAMLRLGLERLGETATESFVDTQFVKFINHYTDHIDVHTRLYDGVLEALDALISADYRLGVCTNKPERQAEILLQSLGIRDRFGAMIGADTLPVRKPDPKPYVAAVERAGVAPAQKVDLNRASATELESVPGIGPSLAKRIVEFRKEHGPFRSVDDLLKVRGIGERSLAKLSPYFTVKG